MAEAFGGSRFPSKTVQILSSNKSKTTPMMTQEEAEALANQFLQPYLNEAAPVKPGEAFITHFSTLQHYKNQAIRARIPLYCTDGLEYNEQHLPIDPYWLGLRLGDGARDGPAVFSYDQDPSVVQYIQGYAHFFNMKVTYNKHTNAYRISRLSGKQPIPPRRNAHTFDFYIPDPVDTRLAACSGETLEDILCDILSLYPHRATTVLPILKNGNLNKYLEQLVDLARGICHLLWKCAGIKGCESYPAHQVLRHLALISTRHIFTMTIFNTSSQLKE